MANGALRNRCRDRMSSSSGWLVWVQMSFGHTALAGKCKCVVFEFDFGVFGHHCQSGYLCKRILTFSVEINIYSPQLIDINAALSFPLSSCSTNQSSSRKITTGHSHGKCFHGTKPYIGYARTLPKHTTCDAIHVLFSWHNNNMQSLYLWLQ